MKRFCQILKSLANKYIILLVWSLSVVNGYLFFKPLDDYAASAGLSTTPLVLDNLYYYTPDEGYEILTVLGEHGRDAYRLANYADFILPILLFLSLSLPNLAMEKSCNYAIIPLLYMISDYIENTAEKYVLEIYPKRNDLIMASTCYFGLIKMISVYGSLLILIFNGLNWASVKYKSSGRTSDEQKLD